jgi:hypothetical protein
MIDRELADLYGSEQRLHMQYSPQKSTGLSFVWRVADTQWYSCRCNRYSKPLVSA